MQSLKGPPISKPYAITFWMRGRAAAIRITTPAGPPLAIRRRNASCARDASTLFSGADRAVDLLQGPNRIAPARHPSSPDCVPPRLPFHPPPHNAIFLMLPPRCARNPCVGGLERRLSASAEAEPEAGPGTQTHAQRHTFRTRATIHQLTCYAGSGWRVHGS
jgi:hypothetical protein